MSDENNMRDNQNEPFEYGSYPQNEPNQTPQYQEPYQYQDPAPQRSGGKGLAIASLVLGILAIVTSCFYINIVFGIIGIVLGIIYLVKAPQDGKGLAIAGIILSAISIAVLIIILVIGIAALGSMSPEQINDLIQLYQ